jgi:hypothetical protein
MSIRRPYDYLKDANNILNFGLAAEAFNVSLLKTECNLYTFKCSANGVHDFNCASDGAIFLSLHYIPGLK